MAYATVDDLEARWHTLTATERERASVLLEDAAVLLESLVDVDETDERQAAQLKTVSCSMVKRAMAASDEMFGVTQGTISADIYSQSYTFSNPGGDLYLTSTEKKLLGISGGFIGSIPAAVGWSG